MIVVAVLLSLLNFADSFYLPGVIPHSFENGDVVDLKVNKLSSVHTQLPYDYYSLKYCKPTNGVKSYSENLGEFLTGDRIENSPYEVKLSMKESDRFATAIKGNYHNNWIVDNLPAASLLDSDLFTVTQYVGFPVGYEEGGENYLFNHVNIVLEYHELDGTDAAANGGGKRIVGFYVEPLSIAHKFTNGMTWSGKSDPPSLSSCNQFAPVEYEDNKSHMKLPKSGGNVIFTYGVEWRESDIVWASRWDVYLSMNKAVSDKVHWFSIINSVLIVLFLAFMVGMILVRTVHRDISGYNRVMTSEERAEEREETGWKLVHADVFRPPSEYPMLFCVVIGTGVQLTFCVFLSILFAAFGFLSPANRGSIMIGLLLFYVLMGCLAGFTSARLYKTFKGKEWQRCTVLTAMLFPGITFGIFILLDIVIASYGSTGAIPMFSLFSLLLLWFGISVPLVFLGAYVGYKTDVLEYPVVTANIPRQIPVQPWYLNTMVVAMIGGILPFGACFVELFFIMSSVWMDQYYYVFGFLLLVFLILVVTCAEMSVVLCYFQLCAEDYHWWWRSVFTAGATAGYVMLYSLIYFARLQSNMNVTYFLYFAYMAIVSMGVFLVTGTIGFVSAYYFNWQIYASIKVD